MKSFKTEIYTLDVIRLSAIYGEQLKYGTIEDDTIYNLDGDPCYRNGEKARVLEINGDDYILESEGRFILTKDELTASQIRNLENGMKKLGNDLIAQGYTQDEVKRILASRKLVTSSKRVKDLKEFFSNENYKILGESGGFLFVEILTYEGAVPLNGYSLGGGGAKWCISLRSTYWDKYADDGYRFVMIICNGDTRMNVAFDVSDSDNRVICQIKGNKVDVWSQNDELLYSGDLNGCPIQIPSLVANSRRAITNANTDGIRAQMAYTLDAVKDFAERYDDWDGTEAQAVEKVLDSFVSAKSRSDGKIHGNIQAELADWLQGLPMSIAFSNYDILKLGEEWGYLPPVDYNNGKYTAKESKWCDNWFMGIANNILKLARKYKVQTPMPAFNSAKKRIKSSNRDDMMSTEDLIGFQDEYSRRSGMEKNRVRDTYGRLTYGEAEDILNRQPDYSDDLGKMYVAPNEIEEFRKEHPEYRDMDSQDIWERIHGIYDSAKRRPIKNNRLIKSGTANYWQDMREFPIVIFESELDEETILEIREANEYGEDISDDEIRQWIEEDDYQFAIEQAEEIIDKYDFNTIKAEIKSGYYVGLQLIFSELDGDGFYWNYTDEDGEWTEEFERDREEDIQKGNELINELVGYGWQKLGVVGRFSNGEAVYTRLDNACGKKKGKKKPIKSEMESEEPADEEVHMNTALDEELANSRRAIKSGMTQKQAERDFIETTSKWSDYYEMQESWTAYIDGLCRDGVISQKQCASWGNPTTPQRFKSWNDRNYGADSDYE